MNVRNDWTLEEVRQLFALPFMDLLFSAQEVHRRFQVPNTVQISTLLSVKTGACPEDCAYCPQSVRYDTGVGREALRRRRGDGLGARRQMIQGCEDAHQFRGRIGKSFLRQAC